MKILSIHLKNLASIEGYFEIDFTAEPLSSAGIYAISGPTGAGKSTILDALCLALYDKTPRFAASDERSMPLADVGEYKINQSDVRNILRRGAGEGFAEIVFLGVDGHRYLSRWSVRRARSKATGSLQAQTMQVQDLDSGEELQGTKTELLNQLAVLVGLNYEQFTRTVLLAQNDFATFLKSRESAKAELLEKLTGTEVYSQISRVVYARSKSAMEAYNLLKNNLSLIEILPEDQLSQLQAEKKAFAEQRMDADKQLSVLNEKLKVLISLQTQQDLLVKKQKHESDEMEILSKFQLQLTQRSEQLDTFRKQCEELQPELRKARELDIQIQTIQAGYSRAEQAYVSSRKRKEETGKVVAEKELLLSRELAKLTFDGSSADSLSQDQKLKQAEEVYLGQYVKQLNTEQKACDELVTRLKSFDIKSLGEEQDRLIRMQKRLQDARQRVVDWLKQQSEQERMTNELTTLHTETERLANELNTLNEQLTTKSQQVKSLQRLYDNARLAVGDKIETIRHNLISGEACPVCGSKEHPYVADGDIVDSLYRSIEKEYKDAFGEFQQLNNRCVALERDYRHQQQQSLQLSNQCATIRKEVEEKTPQKEEERNVEHFDAQLVQLQQQLDLLSARLKEYHQLYEEWQQQNDKVNKLRSQCDAMKELISACHLLLQQVASGKEQFTMVVAAEAEEQNRFFKIRDELDTLRKDRAALLKGKTVDDSEAAIRRYDKELSDSQEAARKEVEHRKNLVSGMQGEIKQLLASIQALTAEKEQLESPEELQASITIQQTRLRDMERQLSVVDARLLQQEQNLLKLKEIETELNEKQTIAGQWEKLNKLIGSADGAKFKVIAQSYTLNLLLMHANKHLSYLSRRYKLQQIPDSLGLQVIDCDMCDEVRTIYSLSGGESFLISLALALGLSSLSSNNLKVESLFIDEGFGSLDTESLRTAMEALEQLQMQGRKIGVISHVQEMSERIPVQIQVRKSVNGRSAIEVVTN